MDADFVEEREEAQKVVDVHLGRALFRVARLVEDLADQLAHVEVVLNHLLMYSLVSVF